MRARMRAIWTGVAAATCIAAACGARAEPRRLALVLGNAAYSQGFLDPLPNALNDMGDMSAALRRVGFEVTSSQDLKNADLARVLDAFSAKVSPGDQVVVFFAGHGVMGGVRRGSEAVENYLTPVESSPATLGRTPPEALALGRVLAALEKADAGPRVIIMDACRQSTADIAKGAGDAAGGPVTGDGLVQPPTVSLKKVFLAFATSPGSFAEDAGEGQAARNGRFTSEILRRIEQPGMTVNRLFEEVSTAVDYGSKGAQVPWFIDGDGSVGALMLKAAAGPAPSPPDPFIRDLRLAREAVECDLPVCLESAAAEVMKPELKAELLKRAAGLRELSRPSAEAAVLAAPQGPPPALDTAALSPTGRLLVAEGRRRPEAWTEIADRLVSGADGFPKDVEAALRWYRAAAQAGSGPGAFALATAHHRGAAGVARSEAEALRWFRAAAAAGYPRAYSMVGEYQEKGLGGLAKDDAAALISYRQGEARGDPVSMRQVAEFTFDGRGGASKDPAAAFAMWRRAAERGDTSAMRRMSVYDKGAQSFAWDKRAAELGDLNAYGQVALDYEEGQGVGKDPVEGLRWRLMAAERGDRYEMERLAGFYESGKGVLPQDCHQAGVWYRRAAIAGSRGALARLYRGSDRYSQGVCVSLR